jgi:hypothetical protein
MSNAITEACLDLAWSHWGALGVAGVVAPPDDAIDLEALLLFTASLGAADPRLRDEALDWCIRFAAKNVSLSRLRRLLRQLPADQRAMFDSFDAILRQHAARWSGVTSSARPAGTFRASGKSTLGSLLQPALLQLRLRRMFGTSARVEVLVALLGTRAEFLGMRTFQWVGYSKQNITATLDDLAASGLTSLARQGNANVYRIRQPHAVEALLDPLPRSAPLWTVRFPVLAALQQLSERVASKPAIVREVELQKELGRHVVALRAAGVQEDELAAKGPHWPWVEDRLLPLLTASP